MIRQTTDSGGFAMSLAIPVWLLIMAIFPYGLYCMVSDFIGWFI